MDRNAALQIIRDSFAHVDVERIEVQRDRLTGRELARVVVRDDQLTEALRGNGEHARRAAMQSGLDVEVVLEPETGSTTTQRRSRWLFALVTTSVVTVAGLAVAVQQFVLKYLWDQSAHTRTMGGILFMLLGVAGICLPGLLFRQKGRFLLLPPSRQWLLALGLPLAHVLAMALCMEASMRSTTLNLPRPFAPTAVVVYEPTDVRVEFRGGWKENLESGYSGANVRRGNDRFSSHLYQGFLRHPRRETVTIVGRVKQMDDGRVQIILDVAATESVRFSVENLDNVMVRRDGQRIGESDSHSGKFQLAMTGRPRNDE